ncbi:TIGR01244 family sulfur transferase [Rhodobacteraceae bacterium]|nr:TIGR01244 family sulfur transferase [Paracoccaceae bacterium]
MTIRGDIALNITKLSDDVSISPQLQIEDLVRVKDLGFQTIIINRPDGEAPDQPGHDQVVDAAKALGLSAYYIPVSPGAEDQSSVDAFASVLASNAGPTLAFCRSGMRSQQLWKRASGQQSMAASVLGRLKGMLG